MILLQFVRSGFVILLIFFISGVKPAGAQRGQWQERHQEMESRRIAWITQQVSLTPAEAKVFWPLYTEYNEKRNDMMLRHRSQRRQVAQLESLSEAELMELADADIRNMEEMTALRRAYHEKFKEVLPLKKVIELYEAERNFNRRLYQEGRRNQREGRGRN